MAGAVGVVPNRSAFPSYVVKDWQPWMTEAVILHSCSISVAELSHRFDKTPTHISNIMRTAQAMEMVQTMQKRAVNALHDDTLTNMRAASAKALGRINQALSDDQLFANAPATVWQLSLKTVETLREKDSAQSLVNQQNNYFLTPEVIQRLASAPTLDPSPPLSHNYESPPAPRRSSAQAVLGSGVGQFPNQSQDGPAVALQWSIKSPDDV